MTRAWFFLFLMSLESLVWGEATIPAAKQEATLTHLKRVKAHSFVGKDWQTLRSLAQTYPRSLATNYEQSTRQLAQMDVQKKKAGARAVAQPPLYDRVKSQRDFSRRKLQAFKRAVEEWVLLVQTKIDYGLYHHNRREFYRDLLPAIEKYVLKESPSKGLMGLHYYVENLSPPRDENASFSERFLKPKYAKEYQERKIKFYQDYKGILEKERVPLALDPVNNKSVLGRLDEKIASVAQRIEHWKTKESSFDKRGRASFTLDQVMGIEALKEMGYQGRGVLLGVLEPPPYYETPQERKAPVHEDLRKRLSAPSSAPAALHGSHVAGIVVARARSVFDRAGVAPKAILYYKESPADQSTDIYYQTAQGLSVKPPTGKVRTLVTSMPRAQADALFSKALGEMSAAGVRFLNTSMVYSVGPLTTKALKEFASTGGVIVKASGNAGVRLESPMKLNTGQLTLIQEYQLGVDLGLFKAILSDPDLKKTYVFVGNMDSATTFDKTSNRAGILQDRFVCAWGTNVPSTVRDKDRRKLTGTSMAAPMVLGALALLQEAYPGCGPQVLAQNILDTAVSLGPARNFGQGRLDLAAAFEMCARSCGLPVPPAQKDAGAVKD
jgi:hypothetical protein